MSDDPSGCPTLSALQLRQNHIWEPTKPSIYPCSRSAVHSPVLTGKLGMSWYLKVCLLAAPSAIRPSPDPQITATFGRWVVWLSSHSVVSLQSSKEQQLTTKKQVEHTWNTSQIHWRANSVNHSSVLSFQNDDDDNDWMKVCSDSPVNFLFKNNTFEFIRFKVVWALLAFI